MVSQEVFLARFRPYDGGLMFEDSREALDYQSDCWNLYDEKEDWPNWESKYGNYLGGMFFN